MRMDMDNRNPEKEQKFVKTVLIVSAVVFVVLIIAMLILF